MIVRKLRDSLAGRPLICTAAFWVTLLAIFTLRAAGYPAGPYPFSFPVVGAVVVVLAACWLVTPWDREASPAGRAAAVAFLALTGAGLVVVADASFIPVMLVAVANCVYVFGARAAVAFVAVVAAIGAAGGWAMRGDGAFALLQGAAIGGFAALGAAATAAVVHSQRLLRDLEAAHAELGRYAERVRELTVVEERARMARDMHDSIGHQLTVIKLDLENAQRFRERRPEEAWQEVAQAKATTQDALLDARRWARAMRPLSLDEPIGPQALAALAASFAGTGVDVRFEVAGGERRLTPDVELVLYRTLQEGLTNALRHAGARRVTASLTYGPREVSLAIADDGAGAANGAGGGFGLSSLAERARALGGALTTATSTGSGFMLRVALPA